MDGLLGTLRNAWKIEELRKKILYTFLIVLVFRIGANIPVPFINTTALNSLVADGSFLGYLNILSGGALQNAALFALGISPYITASIIIQLLTIAIPALEAMSKEGAEGRKKLAKITRYTTLGLAVMQSVAYFILNKNQRTVYVFESGFDNFFVGLVIITSFAAGAMLIVWLGEQIDKKGIGNGISIILFAGIISGAPSSIMYLFNQLRLGGRYYWMVPMIVLIFLFLIYAIVVMTNAERRIPVQYAKRVVGRKMYGGQSSYIPIKVTMSGVMPVIFASALLSIPGMIKNFAYPGVLLTDFQTGDIVPIGFRILSFFDYNQPPYAILYLVLIIAFNFFYVAVQYNPVEMANNLRKNNGTIPGIRPGKPTSDFISRVISKITLVGALFIAAVAILPIIMGGVAQMQIALGGTSIIIVVGVALDTVKQLESQMMMRHYKGFLE